MAFLWCGGFALYPAPVGPNMSPSRSQFSLAQSSPTQGKSQISVPVAGAGIGAGLGSHAEPKSRQARSAALSIPIPLLVVGDGFANGLHLVAELNLIPQELGNQEFGASGDLPGIVLGCLALQALDAIDLDDALLCRDLPKRQHGLLEEKPNAFRADPELIQVSSRILHVSLELAKESEG